MHEHTSPVGGTNRSGNSSKDRGLLFFGPCPTPIYLSPSPSLSLSIHSLYIWAFCPLTLFQPPLHSLFSSFLADLFFLAYLQLLFFFPSTSLKFTVFFIKIRIWLKSRAPYNNKLHKWKWVRGRVNESELFLQNAITAAPLFSSYAIWLMIPKTVAPSFLVSNSMENIWTFNRCLVMVLAWTIFFSVF